MFVVTKVRQPSFGGSHTTVLGIVYNESEFNRFLDENYPGLTSTAKTVKDLTISYCSKDKHGRTFMRMSKIEEIGQPNY